MLDFIEYLAKLPDGWCDGYGHAFNREQLIMFEQLFNRYYSEDLPRPSVYPTTSHDHIQMDWSIGEWEVTVRYQLSNHNGIYQEINVFSDVFAEKALDLQTPHGWQQLEMLLRDLLETQDEN